MCGSSRKRYSQDYLSRGQRSHSPSWSLPSQRIDSAVHPPSLLHPSHGQLRGWRHHLNRPTCGLDHAQRSMEMRMSEVGHRKLATKLRVSWETQLYYVLIILISLDCSLLSLFFYAWQLLTIRNHIKHTRKCSKKSTILGFHSIIHDSGPNSFSPSANAPGRYSSGRGRCQP